MNSILAMTTNPDFIATFGTIATTVTTFSFGLQAWHTIKTRDVSGLSLLMYLVFFIGMCFWVAYSVMLNQMPLIVSQGITLFFAFIVLAIKISAELNKFGGTPPGSKSGDDTIDSAFPVSEMSR